MEIQMNSPASAPSASGPFAVGTHTFEVRDPARDRLFSCDIWCPDEPGVWPLVLYSHHSRSNRRSATYLTTHLASRGYLVAALDHSEVVAPEVADNVQGFIANRVSDARLSSGDSRRFGRLSRRALVAARCGLVRKPVAG
jgi:predicted dienelactone hydrolase